MSEAREQPADVITSAGEGSLAEAAERRRKFAADTQRKKALANEKRGLDAGLSELEQKLLDDYAELGTDTARTEVGEQRYTVFLGTEVNARPMRTGFADDGDPKATDEDWARAVEALKASGLGHFVQERFNLRTLGGWVNELRDEHGPKWRDHLPEPLIEALEISTRQRVRVRKA